MVESNEVSEYFTALIMDEIINDLIIPFNVVESGSAMFVSCEKEIFIDIDNLRIPVVFRDVCSTSGCSGFVYISVPEDHPLRQLLRKAVEQTWLETVEYVRILFYEELFIKDVVFASNVELETIVVECDDPERKTVIQVPLETLRKNLEKILSDKKKVVELVNKTIKLVEDIEKQFKTLDVDVDTEFLRRKLRRSYLSVLKPRDELDVEF